MARYDRRAVREGPYVRYAPNCLCSNAVPYELVVQPFASGTGCHYLLGCVGCGKLARLYIPHDKIFAANKATAKPYRPR